MAIRLTFDTNVHDAVVADSSLESLITECQDRGLISVWATHVQGGELADIPDPRDLGQAKAVANINRTGTALFFVGYSFLGVDRLSSPESLEAFRAIQDGKAKHNNDALIGATAFVDTDFLVTNDSRLRNRFNELAGKAKAISTTELATYLENLRATEGEK